MAKRNTFAGKRSRVATLLRKELNNQEAAGVLEALQLSLPALRERYGYTSPEARATERAIRLLEGKADQ